MQILNNTNKNKLIKKKGYENLLLYLFYFFLKNINN